LDTGFDSDIEVRQGSQGGCPMARIVSERYCRIFWRKIALYGLLIFWSGFCLISGGDATAAELTRLRISIPGLGTTSYPLIMAQKKGYFRTEGYDVELIPMTGGLAVKTLMAGEVNLTSAGTLVASMQGAKLRMVMGFLRQLPYDLVAAPEIKRVEDLRGKKVAVADRGSVTFMVARAILHGHGLEVDKDVTILSLGRPDVRYQALLMGTAQAGIANFDGTGLLEPQGFHSVAAAGKTTRGFAGSLSVTQDLFDKRQDEVMKYLRAALKGRALIWRCATKRTKLPRSGPRSLRRLRPRCTIISPRALWRQTAWSIAKLWMRQ